MESAVKTILKTNNPVLLNYAVVLLKDAGIEAGVFDESMSILDGSMVIIPRRLMVSEDDEERAREILRDGVGGAALEPDRP
nr:DUF2007 domain-containing protein [Rhizomicrobium electricum]